MDDNRGRVTKKWEYFSAVHHAGMRLYGIISNFENLDPLTSAHAVQNLEI